ncbi:glutathione S-transferase [Ramlibacter sp.]|uniref:glutathione S-transferase family protein n=1 Tax=Ramlibacter sp. TaxID=1917967 RepID=UPI0018498B40|nr:glutathione S-transferase [Ramlibacter sp.]MBA2674018.1 glutathione S-transferase [Ramlibacter sp.]
MSNTAPAQPIRLHRMHLSGHSHRVELFLSLLGLPYDMVDVNLGQGEHKSPAFLRMNGFGQVPVIQDGDVTLADSNAILVYLAGRYAPGEWLPSDPLGAARVQRWLSAAAGPLAFGAAAARVMEVFKREGDRTPFIERGHQLLAVMEQELAGQPFLAGERATLADVANYSYVARAPEGGVSLQPYPAVRAWLERIEALPRFVPFARTPVGLAA